MQQKTKRKIAKEIVILFSCSTLIGIVWLAVWSLNEFNLLRVDKLNSEIIAVNHNVDSLYKSFPVSKSLSEILTDKLPEKYKEIENLPLPPWEKASILMQKESVQKNRQVSNIRNLYQLLSTSEFPFLEDFVSFIPDFPYFKKDIEKELNLTTTSNNRPLLKRIYTFLILKGYTNIKIEEFTSVMLALPAPPPHSSWIKYEKAKQKIGVLKIELNKTRLKIYSKPNLKLNITWISIIVFSLLYPIRFLILLLIWAIKTIKNI